MHRIRFIAGAVTLLALVSFAGADTPGGAAPSPLATCSVTGQACPPECCPCPMPCAVGEPELAVASAPETSAR